MRRKFNLSLDFDPRYFGFGFLAEIFVYSPSLVFIVGPFRIRLDREF